MVVESPALRPRRRPGRHRGARRGAGERRAGAVQPQARRRHRGGAGRHAVTQPVAAVRGGDGGAVGAALTTTRPTVIAPRGLASRSRGRIPVIRSRAIRISRLVMRASRRESRSRARISLSQGGVMAQRGH